MEQFNTTKSTRAERLHRNKSGLEDGKWLRRRFARDNEICMRMAESLNEPDHTKTTFFKTFCPDYSMKNMVKLGENPYRNPKMRPHLHKKKIHKFKARARDRKSKMLLCELSVEPPDEVDDFDCVLYERSQQKHSADTVQAWNNHLSLLKSETDDRAMMEIAAKCLIAQAPHLALKRGTKRKWNSVV